MFYRQAVEFVFFQQPVRKLAAVILYCVLLFLLFKIHFVLIYLPLHFILISLITSHISM